MEHPGADNAANHGNQADVEDEFAGQIIPFGPARDDKYGRQEPQHDHKPVGVYGQMQKRYLN